MEQHLKELLGSVWPEPLIETFMTPLEIYVALAAISKSVADTWLLGFLRSEDTLIEIFGAGDSRAIAAGKIKEWQYQDSKFIGKTGIEILSYIENYLK